MPDGTDKGSDDNVRRFPGFGVSAQPTDQGWLTWVRLTANDQQLLSMREDLRRVAEMELGAASMQDSHEQLKGAYMTTLRLLAYELSMRAGAPIEDRDPNVRMRDHVTEQDLNLVGGCELEIRVDEENRGWWLILHEPPAPTSIGGV